MMIRSFKRQGNRNYMECGYISDGPCHGDELWGYGIYQANDQEGCAGKGVNTETAFARRITIKGRCASRCGLGEAVHEWSPSYNSWGAVTYTYSKEKGEGQTEE